MSDSNSSSSQTSFMSNSNSYIAIYEAEGNAMEEYSPPLLPTLPPPLLPTVPPPLLQVRPPPIPPKPKKFNRYLKHHVGESTSFRAPMASPPPTPLTEDPATQGNIHKRKLTLDMSNTLSLPSLPATSSMIVNKGGSAVAVCKSPKLLTPGQSRMWSPVICTICMDDLFSYPEPEPDANSKNFSFSVNASGNFSQPIPRSDNIRPTVSTRCGHLFHTECINKWFMGNKEKELKECPFCKREMMANDTTRIFPIFEDL